MTARDSAGCDIHDHLGGCGPKSCDELLSLGEHGAVLALLALETLLEVGVVGVGDGGGRAAEEEPVGGEEEGDEREEVSRVPLAEHDGGLGRRGRRGALFGAFGRSCGGQDGARRNEKEREDEGRRRVAEGETESGSRSLTVAS